MTHTKPHGTGTIRRKRFEAITRDWPVCEHKCPEHGVWQHRALPTMPCHFPAFQECPECLEYPNGYGRPLMRVEKRD